MDVKQGQKASTGTTTATQINITDLIGPGPYDFFVKVITGTVKVGIGTVPSTQHGWTSSDVVVPISGENGNLYVLQAANGDEFVIGAAQRK